MNLKKLGLAAAISGLMVSSGAFAANSDTDNNGLFETLNVPPTGTVADFDGGPGLFTGSDYWAWTVFGAGPKSDSRVFQVSNLLPGETSLFFSWTTGGGNEVNAMYGSMADGWEPDLQLAPLVGNPLIPPVTGATVFINGNAVAADTIFELAVSNGDVVTLDTAWTGTAGGMQGAVVGVIGTEVNPSAVPVPAAAWLFGSALIGLAGIGRKRKIA